MEVQRTMENNNSSFKKYGAPILVLVLICLVVTAALAATYGAAHPVIVKNAKKAADETRQELLKDADGFTEYKGKLVKTDDGKVEVVEAYTADNKAGVVFTVHTASFGGELTEMVGINAEGEITGVKVTAHSDTPGLGTKAQEPSHLNQYKGIKALSETTCKDDKDITHVTGATVSSNAIHYGVFEALKQYEEMGGVK